MTMDWVASGFVQDSGSREQESSPSGTGEPRVAPGNRHAVIAADIPSHGVRGSKALKFRACPVKMKTTDTGQTCLLALERSSWRGSHPQLLQSSWGSP